MVELHSGRNWQCRIYIYWIEITSSYIRIKMKLNIYELEGINVVSEFLDGLYALYNSLEEEMFLGCIHGVKNDSFLRK